MVTTSDQVAIQFVFLASRSIVLENGTRILGDTSNRDSTFLTPSNILTGEAVIFSAVSQEGQLSLSGSFILLS